jgi:hypothetical protein
MGYSLARDLPRALNPSIVQNINYDLFYLVTMSKRSDFDGKSLDYIFAERHGIVSHGFSLHEKYRIHAKNETCVLIERLDEST